MFLLRNEKQGAVVDARERRNVVARPLKRPSGRRVDEVTASTRHPTRVNPLLILSGGGRPQAPAIYGL